MPSAYLLVGQFHANGSVNFMQLTRSIPCNWGSQFHANLQASYDSLYSRVKSVLNQDPLSGHLFLFINKSRTSMKCLYYDGTGLVVVAKRLERGLFSRINPFYGKEVILTQAEFSLFFEGADLEKRFIDSKVVP